MIEIPTRALVIVASLTCLASAAVAQSSSIQGTVFGPDGKAVDAAPVQARNPETGATFRTVSTATGSYSLTGVAPGNYTLSVAMPGFAYLPFSGADVAVSAAAAKRFDIHLAEGPALGTLADDPGLVSTALRKRAPPRAGPTPHTADGKPDLSGVWIGNDDPYPEDPEMLPWAAALSKKWIEENFKNDPSARCIPGDALLAGSATWQLIQTPAQLVTIVEGPPFVRQVFLDGRGHAAVDNPTWMGDSIGHWEGDTLVVDRVGFNDRGTVGGGPNPRSEKLHVIERYRRPDIGHLEIEFTIDDPGTYAKPWKVHNTWNLAPKGEEVLEYICENNKDLQHLK
jgi:Carboxypeptidase regulatory-like domain